MSPSDLAVAKMEAKLLGSFDTHASALLCAMSLFWQACCLVIQPEILMGQLLLTETRNLGHHLWAEVWN